MIGDIKDRTNNQLEGYIHELRKTSNGSYTRPVGSGFIVDTILGTYHKVSSNYTGIHMTPNIYFQDRSSSKQSSIMRL